jgi:nicotinate-nucleotide adenylyltransferase
VSDIELLAPGPSYTVVTLRALHARGWAPSQLFFITGADAFAEIATWHDYPAVLDASHFVVISRPGYAAQRLTASMPELTARFVNLDAQPGPRLRDESTRTAIFIVAASTTAVSSTEVRRRLGAGEPLDSLMPRSVAEYARRHALYVPTPSPADALHDED